MSRRQISPRKQPRQERARATVAAIVEAGARVFEQRGYAAATTDRIAERAGVSIGTLYQYFPNKDALLVALCERHVADAASRLTPVVLDLANDPPLGSALRAWVRAVVDAHADAPRLHRVLTEETPLPPGLRNALVEAEKVLVSELERYLTRSPEVRAADLRLAAHFVVRTIDATAHRFVIDPVPGITREQVVDEAAHLLESYLRRSR